MSRREEKDQDFLPEKQKKIQKRCSHCGVQYKSISHQKAHSHICPPRDYLDFKQQRANKQKGRGRPSRDLSNNVTAQKQNVPNPLLELKTMRQGRKCIKEQVLNSIKESLAYPLIQRNLSLLASYQKPQFNKKARKLDVSLGQGLRTLLEDIKTTVQDDSFATQLEIFVIIYICFLVDETEDQGVLANGKVDIFIDFLNMFILYYIEAKCEQLGLKETWIAQKGYILKVLGIICAWLNFKDYTRQTAIRNQDELVPE